MSKFLDSGGVTYLWSKIKAYVTNLPIPTKTSDLQNDSGFITDAGVTSFNGNTGAVTYTAPVSSVNTKTGAVTISASDVGALPDSTTIPSAATATPSMDGTGAVGSSSKYAKEDHVHPTDTSRQATLVSGTNIKTVNGNSLLGSGDLVIGGGGEALTDQEIEDAVEAAFVVPVPSGYTISYTSGIQTNTQLRSLSKDGSKVLGEYETSAVEGNIITMWFGGRWEPVVTRADTSASITCTNTEIDTSNGRMTTWTFSMPAASVTIDDYYND